MSDTPMLKLDDAAQLVRDAGIPLGRGRAYTDAASGKLRVGPASVPVHRFGRTYRVSRRAILEAIERVTA